MSTNFNQLMKKRFLLSLSSLLVCSSAVVGFSGKAFGREFNAGPIWNNGHARTVCPQLCTANSMWWNGNWHTTVYRQQSVCSCGWRLELSNERFTRRITQASLWKYRDFKTAISHRGLSPYEAANQVGETVKRLRGVDNLYEIRLSGGDRVTFSIYGQYHVVEIRDVGGHT
ncbi:mannan-binding lectin [Microseira sp. BLCC-F43]|jgi:hypothetical protein|uniref:mannan-binding lectin n=1 Tax=Microseira sp. BLCC-F43 TaxID=3153602 RepID=UPI0035B8B870